MESKPFLVRPPIFYGRGQANGPISSDLSKRAFFLALNSKLEEKSEKERADIWNG